MSFTTGTATNSRDRRQFPMLMSVTHVVRARNVIRAAAASFVRCLCLASQMRQAIIRNICKRGMHTTSSPYCHNRIGAVMAHSPRRYAFCGQARLARDAGVNRSTISRLCAGKSRPTFSLIFAIASLLEQDLGCPIDPRELISLSGVYPTPSVCVLCRCRGCLPSEAYDAEERRLPEYLDLAPGRWTVARSGQIVDACTVADTS